MRVRFGVFAFELCQSNQSTIRQAEFIEGVENVTHLRRYHIIAPTLIRYEMPCMVVFDYLGGLGFKRLRQDRSIGLLYRRVVQLGELWGSALGIRESAGEDKKYTEMEARKTQRWKGREARHMPNRRKLGAQAFLSVQAENGGRGQWHSGAGIVLERGFWCWAQERAKVSGSGVVAQAYLFALVNVVHKQSFECCMQVVVDHL